MSKPCRTSYIRILLLLLALQIFTEARAQPISVNIEVDNKARTARVSGDFKGAGPSGESLQFRRSVTGNNKLYERFSELQTEKVSESGSGSANRATRWSYVVDLAPPEDKTAAAHASWLAEDGGVLMLDDLLPLSAANSEHRIVSVNLRLPDGWSSYTTEGVDGAGRFEVRDRSRSVIFVGSRFREMKTIAGRANLMGNYEIYRGDYRKLFTEPEAIEAVTAADVLRVAKQYLSPRNRTVATLIPEKPE